MEFFQREFFAEFAFRFGSDVEDLELADFVGAGLARHHDVALHFGDGDAVVDGLLARPFFRVEAGVDDEAAGAEEFFVELAEEALGVAFIPAEFDGELLGVEGPAFGERGQATEAAALAEFRDLGELLLERDVEVVAGDAFVVGERAHGDDVEGGAGERGPEHAGERAVGGGETVVRGGGFFGEGRLAFHDDRGLGAEVEGGLGAALGVRGESR